MSEFDRGHGPLSHKNAKLVMKFTASWLRGLLAPLEPSLVFAQTAKFSQGFHGFGRLYAPESPKELETACHNCCM